MDMSKTLRQPVVVAGRIDNCLSRLAGLVLAETEDELRQLLVISNELWTAQGFPMTWNKFSEERADSSSDNKG